jgi:hypothetical protein
MKRVLNCPYQFPSVQFEIVDPFYPLSLFPFRYHTDPSGTFTRYEAKAIGSGSEAAQSDLQDKYHKVRSHSQDLRAFSTSPCLHFSLLFRYTLQPCFTFFTRPHCTCSCVTIRNHIYRSGFCFQCMRANTSLPVNDPTRSSTLGPPSPKTSNGRETGPSQYPTGSSHKGGWIQNPYRR